METLARPRGIILGTTENGDFYGRSPGSGFQGMDAVVEGKNILEGREILSVAPGTGPDFSISQMPGSDEKSMAEVSHVPYAKETNDFLQKLRGVKGGYSPRTTLLEHPGDKDDNATRAAFNRSYHEAEQAQVTITVQGWLKPSGGLWRPPMEVHVKSPMLIMDEKLRLKSATFTQDNRGGTRTTLELTREAGGRIDYSPSGQ